MQPPPAVFAGVLSTEQTTQTGVSLMFRIVTMTGSFSPDGSPEWSRTVSRHRTREAAERALAAYRRDCPLAALNAAIIEDCPL